MRSQPSSRTLSSRSVAARALTPPAHLSPVALGTTLACFGTLTFAVLSSAVARADTVVGPPSTPSGTIAVTPGTLKQKGIGVAIVSSLDTSGDAAMARRAIVVANAALKMMPGYVPVMPTAKSSANSAASKGATTLALHWPLTGRDYQDYGKMLKAPRTLSLTVSPGEGDSSYTATAELYDTKTGGLIGLGRANSTVTPPDVAPATDTPSPATPDVTPAQRALDAAVQSAVYELSRTASFDAVVISKPQGYITHISMGEKDGVRGGARVEYLVEGQPVAYGTITDVGFGESLATVAPETAFPAITVNSAVRIVNNPTRERAIPSLSKVDDREFKRFEGQFALAALVVGAVYLAFD